MLNAQERRCFIKSYAKAYVDFKSAIDDSQCSYALAKTFVALCDEIKSLYTFGVINWECSCLLMEYFTSILHKALA